MKILSFSVTLCLRGRVRLFPQPAGTMEEQSKPQLFAIGSLPVSIPRLFLFLIILSGTTGTIAAQPSTTSKQLWPEIDVYINVKPKVRIFLMGTLSKAVEDGEPRNAQTFEAQIGAHVDYIPNQHLVLRAGYRFGTSVGETEAPIKEQRFLTEQTLRRMLPGNLRLSDRNREDFRFINGDFSFRYRNRVTLEREFPLFQERTITPYVSEEVFYDTRYQTWNRNRLTVGMQTTLKPGPLQRMLLPKHQIILDIYYAWQNDSRSQKPHVNALAVTLAFHF